MKKHKAQYVGLFSILVLASLLSCGTNELADGVYDNGTVIVAAELSNIVMADQSSLVLTSSEKSLVIWNVVGVPGDLVKSLERGRFYLFACTPPGMLVGGKRHFLVQGILTRNGEPVYVDATFDNITIHSNTQ